MAAAGLSGCRLVCGIRPMGMNVKGGQVELHPKSWTRESTKGVQKSMGKELFTEELKLDSVYMRLSQNSQPNSDTPDMNSRKER